MQELDPARMDELIDKVGTALDQATFQEGAETCAIILAKICSDCASPAELLVHALATVHEYYEGFTSPEDKAEAEPKVEN